MPAWVYRILLLGGGLTVGGWLFSWRSPHRPRLPRAAALLLWGIFLLSAALFLGYNVTFVQPQGRYLFPALIPIATAVAVGAAAWLTPLRRRWPPTAFLLPALLALGLCGLDLLALFRFILPQLALQ
ncbi:MAG: hypothetical protein KC418_11105, partial [Anaerolineales bacterium]|nr:hypothetical protein [Anaerolineales bacterium]